MTTARRILGRLDTKLANKLAKLRARPRHANAGERLRKIAYQDPILLRQTESCTRRAPGAVPLPRLREE